MSKKRDLGKRNKPKYRKAKYRETWDDEYQARSKDHRWRKLNPQTWTEGDDFYPLR